MNARDIQTFTHMINNLLDADSGNLSVSFGGAWNARASKSLGLLELIVVHRFPHPDGRIHSTHKQVRLDLTEGTANQAFIFVNDAVTELQRAPLDAQMEVLKEKYA